MTNVPSRETMGDIALFFAQRACTGARNYVDPPHLDHDLKKEGTALKLLLRYPDIATLIRAYLPLLLRELWAALCSDLRKAKAKQRAWHKAKAVYVDNGDGNGLARVTFELSGAVDKAEFSNVTGDLICIADVDIYSSTFCAGRMHMGSIEKRRWLAYLPSGAAQRVQKGREFRVWRFSR